MSRIISITNTSAPAAAIASALRRYMSRARASVQLWNTTLRSPPATTGRMTEIDPPTGTRSVGSLLCELDGGAVDPLDVGQTPEVVEQQRARRIRVGDDQFGTGGDVLLVHVTHHVRCVDVRLRAPGVAVHRHTSALDLGAGATVDDDDVTGVNPCQQVGVTHLGSAHRSGDDGSGGGRA